MSRQWLSDFDLKCPKAEPDKYSLAGCFWVNLILQDDEESHTNLWGRESKPRKLRSHLAYGFCEAIPSGLANEDLNSLKTTTPHLLLSQSNPPTTLSWSGGTYPEKVEMLAGGQPSALFLTETSPPMIQAWYWPLTLKPVLRWRSLSGKRKSSLQDDLSDLTNHFQWCYGARSIFGYCYDPVGVGPDSLGD